MIKKQLLILISLFLCATIIAQNKNSNPETKQTESANIQKKTDLNIYSLAIKYGDLNVAIKSLYNLIEQYPEEISYKDSLAQLYFGIGSYIQCINVCEDILASKKSDTILLRMMAMSFQRIGKPVEAISKLEDVIKLTGSVFDIYQKAAIEYSIKRLQESKRSVEEVISRTNKIDKITLYVDKETKQEVSLEAAALNLYGMIAKDFNDTTNARLLFMKAIEVSPEFYSAKANLKILLDLQKPSLSIRQPLKENR